MAEAGSPVAADDVAAEDVAADEVTPFEVTVSAGTLRPGPGVGVAMAHRWTPDGVVVEADFTGAHLFLLSAAGCVLNDVYREAQRLALPVSGVRVGARGGFDTDTWVCSGVEYYIALDPPASEAEREALLHTVDAVAETPKALRAGTTVVRRDLAT